MTDDREPPVDLRRRQSIHVIGVGGAGMSAIASVLASMGHRVSGSDLKVSAALERLRSQGVEVWVGHRPEAIADADLVTQSTAVPAADPEAAAARARGIPVLRRADLLASISACKATLAVAGTHGKTTTTSMLALILVEAGSHPSFIIGGDVNDVGGGAVWDDAGTWFVVEADESDGTFIELGATAVIVTSVEPDHLEYWGGFEALEHAFERFVTMATGPRVVCADDAGASALAERVGSVTTYGTSAGATWRIVEVVPGRASISFSIVGPGDEPIPVSLPVPGLHNARNATGALVAASLLGVPPTVAVRALARYAGVARRFQFRGEVGGITFVDEYSHLPTEIRAALATARQGGWERVVAVFQPHRYSRTASLHASFADAFGDADRLVVTEIYAAGEAARPGISGKLVVDAVLAAHPDLPVSWIPARAALIEHLRSTLRPGDLCLTLGAGDLTSLPDELTEILASPPAR